VLPGGDRVVDLPAGGVDGRDLGAASRSGPEAASVAASTRVSSAISPNQRRLARVDPVEQVDPVDEVGERDRAEDVCRGVRVPAL
jgi:hypothetical protein